MPLSITIGNKYEDFVETMVANGTYNNKSEVVREALRLLEQQQFFIRLARLHAQGLESGTPVSAAQAHTQLATQLGWK
jgi:antitoxin ParD1/3/4